MDEAAENGLELLAALYEASIGTSRALFEQGLKIQAMELTLRSFPDAKPKYEQSLAALRTPEVVHEFELGERLSLSRVAAIRAGQFPSDETPN